MNTPSCTVLHALFALGLTAAPLAYATAGPVYQFRTFSPGVKPAEAPPVLAPRIEIQTLEGEPLESLDFSDVAIGSNSAQLVAIVKNTGSASLTFASTPFEVPVRFSLANHNCPTQLEPAASCSLAVVFSPVAAEDYSGTLTVNSDAVEGSGSLILQGRGLMTGVVDVVTANDSTFVRKGDGSWYAVGFNGQGELGLGDTLNRNTFTRVPELTGATRVVAGNQHFFAKLFDGRWAATGYNGNGQLGLGDNANRTSFTVVPSLGNAVEVVGAQNRSFAKFADGSWAATGNNSQRELGLGDTVSRNSFTFVPELAGATQVLPGAMFTFAQLSNGKWAATGYNDYGQMGFGDTNPRARFTVVPQLDGAQAVVVGGYSTFAKMSNGSWAATGFNNMGQLGFEDKTTRTSFTTVPKLASATNVVAATYYSTYVRYSDGTWSAVGYNSNGQLGIGNNQNTALLTKVPALSNATHLVTGNETAFAKLADGTWAATGRNYYGHLGLGGNTNRTSFTPIPAQ